MPPSQPVRRDRRSAGGVNGVREQCRLVVASREKPRPMQGNREEEFGIGEDFGASARHPAAIGRRAMRLVAMLEGEHQAAASIVIAKNGAGAVISGGIGKTGTAARVATRIIGERQAAAGAMRWPEKADGAPAARTELAVAADRHATAEATRRQQQIKQAGGGAAQPARRKRERGHGPMTARHPASCQLSGFAAIGAYGHITFMPITAPDHLIVFDRPAMRAKRDRAAAAAGFDFLFAEAGERLLDRLEDIDRRFPIALDLGCRNGALGRGLAGRGGIEYLVQSDPSPLFTARTGGVRLTAEPEFLPFAPASFDVVLSVLLLHWVNDLPGALVQLRRALKPDGLLLASLLAGDTLCELRECLMEAELAEEGGVSPRVSPFAELRDLGGLLQRAGFAMPVVDSDRLTATYPDALALMRELRLMGEGNALLERRRSFSRRATLLRAAALYGERFGDAEGRIPASFEIVTLTAWAPHPDQPKPLRPGSATARLAGALGGAEQSAGEATPAKKG